MRWADLHTRARARRRRIEEEMGMYNYSSVVVQKVLNASGHLARGRGRGPMEGMIHGYRNSMAIMDADKTVICIRTAARFLGEVVKNKGSLHFANSNLLYNDILSHTIRLVNSVHHPDALSPLIGDPLDPWNGPTKTKGGILTNLQTLRLLPEKKARHVRKMNVSLLNMHKRLPDAVVTLNANRERKIIGEAHKLRIPVVALVDPDTTQCLFEKVTYPVPAAETMQFVYLFCNLITKTVLAMNQNPIKSGM